MQEEHKEYAALRPSIDVNAMGQRVRMYAGDLIGRVHGARLLLDDPRISEAHALLSLRRGRFVLLALRRLLMVQGAPARQAILSSGTSVGLARSIQLEVEAIHLPERIMTVSAPGLGQRRLGPEASLFGGASPRILGRFDRDAPCHVWSYAESWRMQYEGTQQTLVDGSEVAIDGTLFAFRSVRLGDADVASTRRPEGAFGSLRLVTYYDGIAVHREGHPVLSIGGIGARIVSELAAFGGPVPWLNVAREVWDDSKACTDFDLRQRWDTALRRLRTKLRKGDVRSDLVRSDGLGNVQLILEAGDSFEDRS